MNACETTGWDTQHGILVCGLDAGHDPEDGHRDVEKQAWFFVRD